MDGLPNGTERGFSFVARFERTLLEERNGRPHHVLGMDWSEGRPVILARPLKELGGELFYEGPPVSIDLTGLRKIDLTTSSELFCVGRMVNGHVPCPGRGVEAGFAQCMECLVQDIPDPSCIFEPHCNRGSCGAFFCQVPHIVYIAIYGKRSKIGMTQASRVKERGMEQGADVILPLVRTRDRHSARALEEWISRRYRLPQSLPSKVVLNNLARPVLLQLSISVASAVQERLRSDQVPMSDILKGRGIKVETLPRDMPSSPIALGPYPVHGKLETVPREVPVDILMGEVVGFKGKWGIVRSDSLAAFRLPDLVGRLMLMGSTD